MTGFTGSEDYCYEMEKKVNICLVCNNRTYSNSCPVVKEQTCIYCSPRDKCESWEPLQLISVTCDPKNDCKYRDNKLVCRFCVRNEGMRFKDSPYRTILIQQIKDLFLSNEYCSVCGVKITNQRLLTNGKIYCPKCERLAK